MRGRQLKILEALDNHPAGMTTLQMIDYFREGMQRQAALNAYGHALRRLEAGGWVKADGTAPCRAAIPGPRPKIWKITAVGRAELDWRLAQSARG